MSPSDLAKIRQSPSTNVHDKALVYGVGSYSGSSEQST